ncbi:MAG: TldD/PmbA family protein, partial [Myxococcales bacterium]|nr:TldD/PmbA family protein [Myxococcales bacterium]
MRAAIALLGALCLPAVALAGPGGDPRQALLAAMEAELDRSTAKLRLEDHEAPYFISHRLVERDEVAVEARFGALLFDATEQARVAAVDVRVGSYRFDSSEKPEDMLLFEPMDGFRPSKAVPLDDDPEAIQATLWLLTDRAYKNALSTFLQKKAKKVTEVEDKHVDSFSKAPAVKHVDDAAKLAVDRARWRQLARTLSARFRGRDLLDGSVRISADHDRTYLVNSEGTRLIAERIIYQIAFHAVGQAPDGMLLEQGATLYGRRWDELPDEAALVAQVDEAIANLEALAKAPVADPYTGPAILEPEATGVFFHEAVGHRLEGERQNDEKEGRTFKGQIGQRILPEFLTVRDDPTTPRYADQGLNGWYRFDDEGVAAQNTFLVQNGVLKAFLTSRTPVEGTAASNGHGRAQGTHRPMARMGNLIVEGAKAGTVSRKKLKAMLLDEVRKQGKPYGLIVRDITGGNTNTSSYGYQAFKGIPRMVYRVDAKTGTETLVRGVEMVGTPLTVVSKVKAVSDEMGVFNG